MATNVFFDSKPACFDNTPSFNTSEALYAYLTGCKERVEDACSKVHDTQISSFLLGAVGGLSVVSGVTRLYTKGIKSKAAWLQLIVGSAAVIHSTATLFFINGSSKLCQFRQLPNTYSIGIAEHLFSKVGIENQTIVCQEGILNLREREYIQSCHVAGEEGAYLVGEAVCHMPFSGVPLHVIVSSDDPRR